MSRPITDLSCKRFGKLTVVSRGDDVERTDGRRRIAWNCVCDCGKHRTVTASNLLSGSSVTCRKCYVSRDVDQGLVREIFDYNSESGLLTHRGARDGVASGSVVGSEDSDSYISVSVLKKTYMAHRVIWLYQYGYFPENEIDHINGNVSDNRICNLREVSRSCNMQNRCKLKNNTSGFSGVKYVKTRRLWSADITMRGKRSFLGLYSNKLDAALARLTAEVCSPGWSCHERSVLVDQVRNVWPGLSMSSTV